MLTTGVTIVGFLLWAILLFFVFMDVMPPIPEIFQSIKLHIINVSAGYNSWEYSELATKIFFLLIALIMLIALVSELKTNIPEKKLFETKQKDVLKRSIPSGRSNRKHFKEISEAKRQKAGHTYEDKCDKSLKTLFGNVYSFIIPLVSKNRFNDLNEALKNARSTTELDLVTINSKGIFAIECKYHFDKAASYVFEENDDIDNLSITRGRKCSFNGKEAINPIQQNTSHIEALRAFLGTESTPIYNIILTNVKSAIFIDAFGIQRATEKGKHIIDLMPIMGISGAIVLTSGKWKKELTEYIAMLPDAVNQNEVNILQEDFRVLASLKMTYLEKHLNYVTKANHVGNAFVDLGAFSFGPEERSNAVEWFNKVLSDSGRTKDDVAVKYKNTL